MSSLRISKELSDKIYFLTLTIYNWYYIFDRHNRFEILVKNLLFCQQEKNLEIFGFVFMLNHLHLLVRAPDLIGIVRNFKSFTSKEFKKNIIVTEPNVLKLFETENEKFNFWQKTNFPRQIESEKFFFQKLNYIHNNPVRKKYVASPEHWLFSSANENQDFLKISQFDEI
jgi:REP element-mobilizing transposase RayT